MRQIRMVIHSATSRTTKKNEHWGLAEDKKVQMRCVPVEYLIIIVDEAVQEEGCEKTRKEGHIKRTGGSNIGGEMRQGGERRHIYSVY